MNTAQTTNMDGAPVRALVLTHTIYGPTVFHAACGKSLADQLRYVASLLTTWARSGCGRDCSVWVKCSPKSRWELA